jgi:hypothetical protein
MLESNLICNENWSREKQVQVASRQLIPQGEDLRYVQRTHVSSLLAQEQRESQVSDKLPYQPAAQ